MKKPIKIQYFFTSDEHYGHSNIIKYCDRPFKDAEKMNESLIKRHNSVVGFNDTVIHAGDFTLESTERAQYYISRLNGYHIFLKGSHDYWNPELPYLYEVEIEGQYIVVCHYAMRVWPRSHHGSWQLYGHSHGKLEPLGGQMDIGVDSNKFYPVSFEEIKRNLTKKSI